MDTELAESMRSHSDILRDNTHFFRQATVFYTKMAQRLVERGFAYDLMAASLDQVWTPHIILLQPSLKVIIIRLKKSKN